ncbi:imidazolonepropionase-like domain-containing protein [Streptomyces alanosinicus]|uniref:Aminodeoxyfutalosine deaminase/Imidazolonepropionase-like composite domain-containing protein n=1 Tax=Streptomyces alanosinicus TaxID=68171 RepID=A0A919D5M9_9ACTN|nr:hypothetical protein [Streptomyces alanosinicus]GHE12173.1 hypothetical protein GCM10010339_74510 [Streptomyces alanosinicus]
MLTIHADSREHALVVQGERIAATGSLAELVVAYPRARLRTWPGVLTPGLVNPHGTELLEQAYHPDPREADTLGSEPLTGDALIALALDDGRWGASARRGVQRMLAHGTVAAACATLGNRAVRDAVRRTGLAIVAREGHPGGVPCLDPLASGVPPVFASPRAPGSEACFTVFDVRDESELAERGAGTCVATVVAGRLVFRRR